MPTAHIAATESPAGPNTGEPEALTELQLQRLRAYRLAKLGKRIGYLAFLVSSLAFAVALVTGFRFHSGTVMAAGLIVACAVMPIAVVAGYGVRAAAREDRAHAASANAR